MNCMLSLPVFIHLRRLRIGEDSLKVDDIDGCFYILFYCYIISSVHSRPLVPRQTWCLTGDKHWRSFYHRTDCCRFVVQLIRQRLEIETGSVCFQSRWNSSYNWEYRILTDKGYPSMQPDFNHSHHRRALRHVLHYCR